MEVQKLSNEVKHMEVKESVDRKQSLQQKNEFPYDEELYLDIRKFIRDHLDLVEEDEYDILTVKVIESWLQYKLKEIGYVFFIGPPRSGKTRAMEVLSSICYNPKIAAYMSAPAIYRTLNESIEMEGLGCTLFLDEIHQYLSEDKTSFLAILNAGQRKGQKARIMVRGRDDWEPKEFEVFGSKFLASTENTAKALATRCIIITMVKNYRKVPLRIDKDRADRLRERLDKYTGKAGPKKLPDLEPRFHEMEFHDYRNIETFINLVSLAPPIYRENILRYAKGIDEKIAEEEGINFYADLFRALEVSYKTLARDGKVLLGDVADIYNDGRPEQERLTNKTIGYHLNILGLNRVCRTNRGMGRYISENLMKRLRRRYRTGQQILEKNK